MTEIHKLYRVLIIERCITSNSVVYTRNVSHIAHHQLQKLGRDTGMTRNGGHLNNSLAYESTTPTHLQISGSGPMAVCQ